MKKIVAMILCTTFFSAQSLKADYVGIDYLNCSDEWARNRFKVLSYDKRKLPQSSMKSKNKVLDK